MAVQQPRTGPLSSLPHSALCFSLAPTFPPQRRGRAETSDQQAQPRSIGHCIGGCFLFSSLCECTRPVEFIQFRFTLFSLDHAEVFFFCCLIPTHFFSEPAARRLACVGSAAQRQLKRSARLGLNPPRKHLWTLRNKPESLQRR